METGDTDIVRAVSRYRDEYLEESYWLELSEKYVQVYFQSATDINHPYIQLVRLVPSFIFSRHYICYMFSNSFTKFSASYKFVGHTNPILMIVVAFEIILKLWYCIEETNII